MITPNIIASNKSHTWIVPDINSSYIKIRVTDIQENTRYDESDDTFTLFSEPFIKVISPNGGEMWKVGSTQNIVWDFYGLIDVTIEYSIDNDDTWKTLISNASASNKNYGFTVPSDISSDCKIKIIDESKSLVMPKRYLLMYNKYTIALCDILGFSDLVKDNPLDAVIDAGYPVVTFFEEVVRLTADGVVKDVFRTAVTAPAAHDGEVFLC